MLSRDAVHPSATKKLSSPNHDLDHLAGDMKSKDEQSTVIRTSIIINNSKSRNDIFDHNFLSSSNNNLVVAQDQEALGHACADPRIISINEQSISRQFKKKAQPRKRRPDTAQHARRRQGAFVTTQSGNTFVKNIHTNMLLYQSLHHDIKAIDQNAHINMQKIPTIFGSAKQSELKASSAQRSRPFTHLGLLHETSSSLNKNKKLMQLLQNDNSWTQNMR